MHELFRYPGGTRWASASSQAPDRGLTKVVRLEAS